MAKDDDEVPLQSSAIYLGRVTLAALDKAAWIVGPAQRWRFDLRKQPMSLFVLPVCPASMSAALPSACRE
jgi:hypothetical protein